MVLNEIHGNNAYPNNRHDKYKRIGDCMQNEAAKSYFTRSAT